MEYLNSDLAKRIWESKYRHNNETLDDWFVRVSGGDKYIERLIREKKFIFGGRTLSNRGLIGSLSNCYTSGRVGDSLSEIMDTCKNIALTFKAQGGQGVSLSLIRPIGTSVAGRYQSDGIVPFMEIFDKITGSISQGGGRRGALLMSLDITHKEAETFMKIKTDLNRINNANLSLEINDEFMYAVQKYYTDNEEIEMHCSRKYEDSVIEYTIVPIKLFKLLCKYAWECAEPGVLFMDTINTYNLNQYDKDYTIECVNPCGEQPLIKNGACNLSAINLAKYVQNPFTNDVKFNYSELAEDLPHIYKAMNDVIDEGMEKHALKEQREAAENWRNIGIGITGLAEVFIMFQTPYGSDKSKELTKEIMKFLFKECFKLNQFFGKKYGCFAKFKVSNDYGLTDIVNHSFGKEYSEKPVRYLRNCSMLTIAPTGSISNLIGASTMGIEPLFALQYQRKTVSIDGKESVYTVYPEIVEYYLKLHPEDTVDSLPYYFVTANDIPWKLRVDIQAIAQEYVDTAISSTTNLPQETTINEVEQLYLYAWSKGLKGITIYRDGSRDPVLFVNKEEQKQPLKVKKRPKVINSTLYKITVNGEKFAVVVGELDKKPYEVFAFKIPEDRTDIVESTGSTIKIKKGLFKFVSSSYSYTIDNLNDYYGNIEERATTLYISMLLRHHADINFIIKTAKKVNPVISSFTSAVCRVLNKYYDDNDDTSYAVCPECGEKLIKHGGCKECTNCGYSVCNLMICKK